MFALGMGKFSCFYDFRWFFFKKRLGHLYFWCVLRFNLVLFMGSEKAFVLFVGSGKTFSFGGVVKEACTFGGVHPTFGGVVFIAEYDSNPAKGH